MQMLISEVIVALKGLYLPISVFLKNYDVKLT